MSRISLGGKSERGKAAHSRRILMFKLPHWFASKFMHVVSGLILYLLGYFNAYHFAALNTSADIFVHLGDYVGSSYSSKASVNAIKDI